MFKSTLSALALLGVVSFSAVAPAMAINSEATTSDEASLTVMAEADPDQTKFSIPLAKINLNPAHLRAGQKINVSVPVTNNAEHTSLDLTFSSSNAPTWISVTNPVAVKGLTQSSKTTVDYVLKIGTIPSDAATETIKFTATGEKPVAAESTASF